MLTGLLKSFDLSGRVALITGASSGIGKAIVEIFAESNCSTIIIVARRHDKLHDLKMKLEAVPSATRIVPVVLDVCDVHSIQQLPMLLASEHNICNGVDILVNNAGLAYGVEPGDRVDLDDCRRMLDTNVLSCMAFVTAFVPLMRDKGTLCDIVNIGSVAGFESYAGGSIYCATKHALEGYTNSREWHFYAHTTPEIRQILHPIRSYFYPKILTML